MPQPLDLQIRDRAINYLSGQATLDQFLDWFMGAAEDAEETRDATLLDLVDTIKLYWAEYSNGDRTEGDLRTALRRITETSQATYDASTAPGAPHLQTGTETKTAV